MLVQIQVAGRAFASRQRRVRRPLRKVPSELGDANLNGFNGISKPQREQLFNRAAEQY